MENFQKLCPAMVDQHTVHRALETHSKADRFRYSSSVKADEH